MSEIAKKALSYYRRGLWNKKMIVALLNAGKITQEEYDIIINDGEN